MSTQKEGKIPFFFIVHYVVVKRSEPFAIHFIHISTKAFVFSALFAYPF